MPMARPCDIFEALTSHLRGSSKNLLTYCWTPTVVIFKAPSAAASMGSSPNLNHMQVLTYAKNPASCDRIAGRPFT